MTRTCATCGKHLSADEPKFPYALGWVQCGDCHDGRMIAAQAREAARLLSDADLVAQYAQGNAEIIPEAWQGVLEEIDRRGARIHPLIRQVEATNRGRMLCLSCEEEVPLTAVKCKHCGSDLRVNTTPEIQKQPNESAALGSVGWLLTVLGIGGLIWAFQLDTTVADVGGRVHNFSLLNDKQNYVILSGIATIIGAIFIAIGSKS